MDRGPTAQHSNAGPNSVDSKEHKLELKDLLELDPDTHPSACSDKLWSHWVKVGHAVDDANHVMSEMHSCLKSDK